MESIKSFIFLNDEKIISLSSQISEGVVESLVKINKNQKNVYQEESTILKPVTRGFGKIGEEEKIETIVLGDYIYLELEKKLIEKKKMIILEANQENVSESIKDLKPLSFVKIKSKAKFLDVEYIVKILSNIENFGKAIANCILRADGRERQIKDSDIKEYMKKSGLSFDKKLSESLIELYNFSNKNLFEIEMEIEGFKFTAQLNEKYLREKKEELMYKLSMSTEVELTLFGIVTQTPLKEKNITNSSFDEKELSFKEATKVLLEPLQQVENSFSGAASNELRIDPLAIYLEL